MTVYCFCGERFASRREVAEHSAIIAPPRAVFHPDHFPVSVQVINFRGYLRLSGVSEEEAKRQALAMAKEGG